METKKRRVRRTPESYREEVEKITNGEYSVLGEFVNTTTKILHAHKECGYEWEVSPNTFVNNGSRCPECYAQMRGFRTPDGYHKEVEVATFGEYSVIGEFINSLTKVTHVHNVCEHVWEVTPNNFINNGSRCPKCHTRKSRKTNEQFVAEVYDLVGGEYTFLEPYTKAINKIKVRHNICGLEYEAVPIHFLNGNRCPNCVYYRGEKAVADVLDSLSIEYSREHTFEYLGRKRYDFFIPSLNIAIEYDGEQHFKAVDHWGGEEALKRTQESDALKNDFCEYMGIDLLRIPYWEFDNIHEIVTNFIDTVKLMRSISANSVELAKCR